MLGANEQQLKFDETTRPHKIRNIKDYLATSKQCGAYSDKYNMRSIKLQWHSPDAFLKTIEYNNREKAEQIIDQNNREEVSSLAEPEKIFDWIREDIRASEERHREMEERMEARMIQSEERQRAMEERIDLHMIESEKRIERRLDKIDANQEKLESKIDNDKKHKQTIFFAIIAALAAIASFLLTL